MFLTHLVPAATPDVPKVGGTDPILAFAELPLEEEGEGQGEIGGGEAALEAVPAVRKRWGQGGRLGGPEEAKWAELGDRWREERDFLSWGESVPKATRSGLRRLLSSRA